jgi:hypothetical protein
MKAIRRVAEILIQLPLEECLELHDKALEKGDMEDPVQYAKAQATVRNSRQMLEAMNTVRLLRMEARVNNTPQENSTNALTAAAWAGMLSK